jgi:hypothetical protein
MTKVLEIPRAICGDFCITLSDNRLKDFHMGVYGGPLLIVSDGHQSARSTYDGDSRELELTHEFKLKLSSDR